MERQHKGFIRLHNQANKTMKLLTYLKSLFTSEPEKPVFISQKDQRILDYITMLDLLEDLNNKEND